MKLRSISAKSSTRNSEVVKLWLNHARPYRFTRFPSRSPSKPTQHDVARNHKHFRVGPEECETGFPGPESVRLSTESSTVPPLAREVMHG